MLMCALSEPICTRKMLFVVVLARAGLSAPWFTEAVSVKKLHPSHIRSTSSSAHNHGLDVAKCTRIAVSLSFAQTRGQEEKDQPKLLGEALLPVQGRDEGGTG